MQSLSWTQSSPIAPSPRPVLELESDPEEDSEPLPLLPLLSLLPVWDPPLLESDPRPDDELPIAPLVPSVSEGSAVSDDVMPPPLIVAVVSESALSPADDVGCDVSAPEVGVCGTPSSLQPDSTQTQTTGPSPIPNHLMLANVPRRDFGQRSSSP
jgi:hypothetical protein